uniref:Uncharacterized protein n=1 Tax=Corethrella appendiculata TaxID=1370023 RepID=U5ED61_9DIPT
MAQGKLKVKSKLPAKAQAKKNQKLKGTAFNKRKNAPIQSKKHKFQEAHKLKEMVSKALNKKNEDDIRKVVYEGQTNLSKAQEAVVKHHQKVSSSDGASTSGC